MIIYGATKDEIPQPYTDEQMTDIKSQFHPSNTANVNIVPYHIYDEDEHVVGEWRETINGVKKKKTVYERTINTTTSATTGNDKEISIGDGVSVDKYIEIKGLFEQTVAPNKYTYPFFMTDNSLTGYVKIYANNNNIVIRVTQQAWLNMPISITAQYTKTSDEWQPV
jgi:hypothetical protein